MNDGATAIIHHTDRSTVVASVVGALNLPARRGDDASVQLENVTHVQPDDIVLVAIIQEHVLHVSLVNTIAYWGKLVKALAKSVNEGTTVRVVEIELLVPTDVITI